MTQEVTCPICNAQISISDNILPDVALSPHLDRCARVTRRKVKRLSWSSFEEDEEEFDLDPKPGNKRTNISREKGKDIVSSGLGGKDDSIDAQSVVSQDSRDFSISSSTRPTAVPVDVVTDDWEDKDFEFRLKCSQVSSIKWAMSSFGSDILDNLWETSLYEHQKEGCRWLYQLYREGTGGILADEMGLGKTCQLCTHFGSIARLHQPAVSLASTGALNPRSIPAAIFLVVCPATIMQHWLKEFHHWAPQLRTVILHSISATGSELLTLGNDSKDHKDLFFDLSH
jgi:SNF2 family DNA or RNA helicase